MSFRSKILIASGLFVMLLGSFFIISLYISTTATPPITMDDKEAVPEPAVSEEAPARTEKGSQATVAQVPTVAETQHTQVKLKTKTTAPEIKKRIASHLAAFNDLAGDAVYIIGDGRAEVVDDVATLHSEYVADTVNPWRDRHDALNKAIEETRTMIEACSPTPSLAEAGSKLIYLMQAQELLWQAVTEAAISHPKEGRKMLKEARRAVKGDFFR